MYWFRESLEIVVGAEVITVAPLFEAVGEDGRPARRWTRGTEQCRPVRYENANRRPSSVDRRRRGGM